MPVRAKYLFILLLLRGTIPLHTGSHRGLLGEFPRPPPPTPNGMVGAQRGNPCAGVGFLGVPQRPVGGAWVGWGVLLIAWDMKPGQMA